MALPAALPRLAPPRNPQRLSSGRARLWAHTHSLAGLAPSNARCTRCRAKAVHRSDVRPSFKPIYHNSIPRGRDAAGCAGTGLTAGPLAPTPCACPQFRAAGQGQPGPIHGDRGCGMAAPGPPGPTARTTEWGWSASRTPSPATEGGGAGGREGTPATPATPARHVRPVQRGPRQRPGLLNRCHGPAWPCPARSPEAAGLAAGPAAGPERPRGLDARRGPSGPKPPQGSPALARCLARAARGGGAGPRRGPRTTLATASYC